MTPSAASGHSAWITIGDSIPGRLVARDIPLTRRDTGAGSARYWRRRLRPGFQAAMRTWEIGSRIELPPRIFRGHLTGFLFESERTFLLPKAMTGIRGLRIYYDQHPRLTVLVTGHTDTQGPTSYNQFLSEERARVVAAFLTTTWRRG